jgi:hypothetical protein
MSLPKISLPLFEITVPSTGKKVKYRPFTVREEKILLVAQESKDIDQITLSIKQVLNNCLDNVDVESLAIFDIEYLLMNIRAKSVNNITKFSIVDPETQETVNLEVDINEIHIKKNPDHSNKIKIDDDNVIIMKYPSLNNMKTILENTDNNEKLFDMILSSIKTLVSGDAVYNFSDYTKEEIEEFSLGLHPKVIMEIQKFYETMPVIRFEKKYTRKDGVEKTFVMEGLEGFFM